MRVVWNTFACHVKRRKMQVRKNTNYSLKHFVNIFKLCFLQKKSHLLIKEFNDSTKIAQWLKYTSDLFENRNK